MSGDYRLSALFDLREHALKEAEQTLALAVEELARQELAQTERDACVNALVGKLARRKHEGGLPRRAADLQAQARFEARLEDELRAAEQVAAAHRNGPLAAAQRSLAQAQAAHIQAKQDLKVISRHREAAEDTAQRLAERQGEDDVETWLRARRS